MQLEPKFKVGDRVRTPKSEGSMEVIEVIHHPHLKTYMYTYMCRPTVICPFDQEDLEKFHA